MKYITWKRIEYRISNCAKKKVKTGPYSILIQKSKGSGAFDEQKGKNIAIKYRLQLIFPNSYFQLNVYKLNILWKQKNIHCAPTN